MKLQGSVEVLVVEVSFTSHIEYTKELVVIEIGSPLLNFEFRAVTFTYFCMHNFGEQHLSRQAKLEQQLLQTRNPETSLLVIEQRYQFPFSNIKVFQTFSQLKLLFSLLNFTVCNVT